MQCLWSRPANPLSIETNTVRGQTSLPEKVLVIFSDGIFHRYLPPFHLVSTSNLERSKPNILASPYLTLAMAGVN